MNLFDPSWFIEFEEVAGEPTIYANIRECICRDITANVINTDFAKEVISTKKTLELGVGGA